MRLYDAPDPLTAYEAHEHWPAFWARWKATPVHDRKYVCVDPQVPEKSKALMTFSEAVERVKTLHAQRAAEPKPPSVNPTPARVAKAAPQNNELTLLRKEVKLLETLVMRAFGDGMIRKDVSAVPNLDNAALASLELRVRELEQFPFEDAGIWQESATYHKRAVVTHGGSMWIAQGTSTGERPGKSREWRLAIKRGKDGKPGRDGKDAAPPSTALVPITPDGEPHEQLPARDSDN